LQPTRRRTTSKQMGCNSIKPIWPLTIRDQITRMRQAGYGDGPIRSYIQYSKTCGPKFRASVQAGHRPAEIWAYLGLPLTKSATKQAMRPNIGRLAA